MLILERVLRDFRAPRLPARPEPALAGSGLAQKPESARADSGLAHQLALFGNRHGLDLGRRSTPLPAALPPDEDDERREPEEPGHEDVEAQARDLVRRVDAERLDPEAPDAVDQHV